MQIAVPQFVRSAEEKVAEEALQIFRGRSDALLRTLALFFCPLILQMTQIIFKNDYIC